MYLHSSPCWHSLRLVLFVENAFFFPLCISGFFIFKKSGVCRYVDFVWVFNWIPLTTSFFFLMPTTFSFDCYISVGQHEISDSDTSGCTFILQDCFNYLEIVFFCFLYETEYCPFKVCKELCWNFVVTILEFWSFSLKKTGILWECGFVLIPSVEI